MAKGVTDYALLLGLAEPPAPPAAACTWPLEEDEPEDAAPTGPAVTPMTEMALRCIEAGARISTPAIAKALGLSTKAVWGLLKNHRESGRVLYQNRRWIWNPEYVPGEVRRAAELLRRHGWKLVEPSDKRKGADS